MGTGRWVWRLNGVHSDVLLELSPRPAPPEAREESTREIERVAFDLRYGGGGNRDVLLEVYARLVGLGRAAVRRELRGFDVGSPRLAAVAEALVAAARAGTLVARTEPRRRVVMHVALPIPTSLLGPATEPPPAETTWVEIELLGEDDEPIPGEAYHLETADGDTRDGTLDGKGRARVEGVSPGRCKVSFPNLDHDAWSPR
jgi:hypothetical protein